MSTPPSRPSLRDFDYFDEQSQPAAWDDLNAAEALPDRLAEGIAAHKRSRRHFRRFFGLMFMTLAACGWVLWGFVHDFRYAFAEAVPPLLLGDVVQLEPAEIPHNRFVRVQGITEHRGLAQRIARGLSFDRQEYWYFRLLGSRGVFIEVLANAEGFGYVTEVDVRGRALDPRQSGGYEALLGLYSETFMAQERTEVRVIQVGMRPGQGRWPWYVVLGVMGVLLMSNGVAALRLVRTRRRRPEDWVLRGG